MTGMPIDPVWVTGHFRFENDDGTTLDNSTFIAAEDTAAGIVNVDTNFRLRFNWGDSAVATRNNAFAPILQYRVDSGTWINVGAAGTSAEDVVIATSSILADNAISTTERLVARPTGVGNYLRTRFEEGTANATTETVSDECVENVWNLTLVGSQVIGGSTIDFRIIATGETITTIDTTPSLTVESIDPVWVTGHFRFYDDDGTGFNDSTALAAVDTDVSVALDTTFHLRMNWGENAGQNTGDNFTPRLQHQINNGTWTNVTTTSAVKAVNSSIAIADEATIGTTLLSASPPTGCATDEDLAEWDETGVGVQRTSVDSWWELNHILQLDSASVSDADLIDFRYIDDASSETVTTRDTEPRVTAVGPIPPNWVSGHFRFENDDGSVSASTFIDAEDTNINLALDTNFRVRINWGEADGQETATEFKPLLEFRKNGGSWGTVGTSGDVKMVSSAHETDESTTVDERLTTAPLGCASYVDTRFASTNSALPQDTPVDAYHEGVWNMSMDSASASNGDEYEFRIVDANVLEVFTTTQTIPMITAGEGDFTLVADSGVYSTTGIATGLLFSPAIIADSGSYTLSGATAILSKMFTLMADSGVYSLSGTAAAVVPDFTVLADPGVYALTGTVLDLQFSPVMIADPGSYALTGTVTGLLLGFNLAVDSGVYGLTGTAVDFLFSPVMVADPGSYALTGTVSNLEFHASLIADPGSYALTGTTTALLLGFNLAVDSGVYSLSGTTSDLLFSPVMVADPGVYALTGTPIDFLFSPVMVADPGSYALTGTTTELLKGFNLAVDSGIYGHTGVAVNFLFDPALIADPGVYTLSGTATALEGSFVLEAAGPTKQLEDFEATFPNSDDFSDWAVWSGGATTDPTCVRSSSNVTEGSFSWFVEKLQTENVNAGLEIFTYQGDNPFDLSAYNAIECDVFVDTIPAGENVNLWIGDSTFDGMAVGTPLGATGAFTLRVLFDDIADFNPDLINDILVYATGGPFAFYVDNLRALTVPSTYTMTGMAGSLEFGASLIADNGIYALTGTATDLQLSASLIADPGVYALSGTAAAVVPDFTIIADPGVYALTGNALDLQFSPVMIAEPGVYNVMGTDSNLEFHSVLLADSGVYALTGTAATLTFGSMGSFTLTADSGVYSLSGTATGLEKDSILVADSGVYTLTGIDAGLAPDFTVFADPGSYALTGTLLDFLFDANLIADPGAYILSGNSVNLTFNGVDDISLQSIISSTIADLDATIEASYDGSAQLWKNLVANPADGSAQSDNDFVLGTSQTPSTDDPTFIGTAGDKGAYFLHDGGDLYTIEPGVNTDFLKSLHKTTGGSDFWIAVAGQFPDGAAQVLFSTGNFLEEGLHLAKAASTAPQLMQSITGTAQFLTSSLTIPVTPTICIVSYNAATGDLSFWVDNPTSNVLSPTFNTTIADADGPAAIAGSVDGSSKILNLSRMYGAAYGNSYLDDEEAANIFDFLNARRRSSGFWPIIQRRRRRSAC